MSQLAIEYLKKEKVWAWNTGALYTMQGQRLGAILLPGGKAYFTDIDRHIDGVTLMPITGQYVNLKEFVTHAYDYCHFNSGPYDMRPLFPHLGHDGIRSITEFVKYAAQSVGAEKTWTAVHVPFEENLT